MGLPSWYHLARSLDQAGDTARALQVLSDAASAGQTHALVSLAQLKWKHGAFHEAVEFIEEAERKVAMDDWETHFALHLAYAIGIGPSDYELVHERAFKHLVIAATESGDPRMKLSVGAHYWGGTNLVERNMELAEQWLSEAASSGIPDIVADYKSFLRAKKKLAKNAP